MALSSPSPAPSSPALVWPDAGRSAVAVRITGPGDLPRAVGELGLAGARPVLAVVGGASGLDGPALDRLATLFTDAIGPAVRALGATAVDGGTDHGVMRLLGRERAAGALFPLVGVAASGTVNYPGHDGDNPESAPLEPNHSHFLLVPGTSWGDEADYLARTATVLAGDRPSVTVLVNGGGISLDDAGHSIAQNRPVLVLAGTGRTADRIAAAAADPAHCRDARAVAVALSPLVRILDVTDREAAAEALTAALGG